MEPTCMSHMISSHSLSAQPCDVKRRACILDPQARCLLLTMSSQPQPESAAPAMPNWYEDMLALVELTASLENISSLVDGTHFITFAFDKLAHMFISLRTSP